MPLLGIEPKTYSLQSWCSTTELKRQVVDMGLEPTTFRVETECTIHCANRLKMEQAGLEPATLAEKWQCTAFCASVPVVIYAPPRAHLSHPSISNPRLQTEPGAHILRL